MATTLADFITLLGTVRTQALASPLTAAATIDAWLLANPNPVGSLQYAEITIPTASVLALFGTPYTLVAAPGAGLVLEFKSAVIILDYAGVAYAGVASNEDLAVRFTDASGVIASTTLEATGFIDQTADQIRTIKCLTTDITPVPNSPLLLHMLNGEITTGTSPLRVKVEYRVHATGL